MMMTRRTFLKNALALSVGGALVGGGYGVYEMGQLSLEQVAVPISRLPDSLVGFRIVQMSDFHLYPYTTLELINRAVGIVNQLQPDLVVLTGDYVWHESEAIFDLLPALNQLNPTHGVFAILGNHDIAYQRRPLMERAFAQTDIRLLVNDAVLLTVGRSQLYLAGLDDALVWRPPGEQTEFGNNWLNYRWNGERIQRNLQTALANLPADVSCVLLAHEPDIAGLVAQDGRVALQLSGHTHGGQIRLPGVGALALPPLGRIYDQGLYRLQNLQLYTNRGIGSTFLPMRWNCPPEITEIMLI